MQEKLSYITESDGRLDPEGSQRGEGGELVLETERTYLSHLFDSEATIFYSASDARAGQVNWVDVESGDGSLRYRILHGNKIGGKSSFQVDFIRGDYQGCSLDIFTAKLDIEAFTLCAQIISDIEGSLRNSSIYATKIDFNPGGLVVNPERAYMNVMEDTESTTIRYRVNSRHELMWMQVENESCNLRFIITRLDFPLHYRVVIEDKDGIREDLITFEEDEAACWLCLLLKTQVQREIDGRYRSRES